MQAIGMRAMARRIVRFSRDRKACLYYAACICLLVAAAGLRFHDLPEQSLSLDEAVAANISRGALSTIIYNTGHRNSSPILYPLALWAIQQVESTPFSIRVLPATASVLTVAVMLLLLPRLGVARGAAFLAALLATLSVEAIRHAQDAREYSIDALLAVLMLAGLLWYLRDRRKALLCVSLFLAPLLQYGLVLFGVAVIGAAAVVPRVSGQERRSAYLGRIGGWLKRRLDLVVPCGFFLAGGALSYLMTLRYQWQEGGFGSDGHLLGYYYQGEFDAHSIFEFSIDGIWSLLKYHLPEVVAIAVLPAFAILLVVAFLGKFQGKFQDGAIAVLFSFCIAVSVGTAVLAIYPIGGIRQGIYLGPIVFLAVGVAFHWIAGCLSSLTRRGWTMPALLVAIAGAMVFAGVSAMRQNSPYKTSEDIKSVLVVLKERVREEDMVYVDRRAVPGVLFYQGKEETPTNYYFANSWCRPPAISCLREMANLAYNLGMVNGKIWFVTYYGKPAALENDMPGFSVERVISRGAPKLYLIEGLESLTKIVVDTMLKDIPALPRNPSIHSTFDVYLSEDMLIYVKEPCSAEDVQETFFVHVFPVDVDDLPARHQRRGFDNLDFRFTHQGVRSAERCVALRELPDYDFNDIHTGQYLIREDGSTARLWTGEIRVDE